MLGSTFPLSVTISAGMLATLLCQQAGAAMGCAAACVGAEPMEDCTGQAARLLGLFLNWAVASDMTCSISPASGK